MLAVFVEVKRGQARPGIGDAGSCEPQELEV